MDDGERTELEVAVVAHCQWLQQRGVTVPAAPDKLAAWQISQNLWLAPAGLQLPATAVLSNLAGLCAFRTREGLSTAREDVRKHARQHVAEATPENRAAEEARLEIVLAGTDESDVAAALPALEQLAGRLRTGERAVAEFIVARKKAHKAAAKAGFSSLSLVDIAQARWLAAALRRLEDDLEFFRGQVLGQEIAAHQGPTDGRAWQRLRGECLLRLKEASVERAALSFFFPSVQPESLDPKRRKAQRALLAERDDKAIKRAKERRSPRRKEGAKKSQITPA